MIEKQRLIEEQTRLHAEYLRLNEISARPDRVGAQACRDMIRNGRRSEEIEDRLMEID